MAVMMVYAAKTRMRQSGQTQLRLKVGMTLLSLTLGSQLLWSLVLR